MTTPKPRPSIVHGESHAYPVLPLRDIVVFPHMIVPLFVGREKSIRALEEVMKNDALIMLATQKNASDDDPAPDSIYETGTLASVLPGVGPLATIAMLLPITFGLPPVGALIMLAGIYYGAQYGGSTTSAEIFLLSFT